MIFMNKWLLRLLRQGTKKIKPTSSAFIIRSISEMLKGELNPQRVSKKIKAWGKLRAVILLKRGRVTKKDVADFLYAVSFLAKIWTSVCSALWKALHLSVVFLLKKCLKPSLGNDPPPRQAELLLQKIKYRIPKFHNGLTGNSLTDGVTAPAI